MRVFCEWGSQKWALWSPSDLTELTKVMIWPFYTGFEMRMFQTADEFQKARPHSIPNESWALPISNSALRVLRFVKLFNEALNKNNAVICVSAKILSTPDVHFYTLFWDANDIKKKKNEKKYNTKSYFITNDLNSSRDWFENKAIFNLAQTTAGSSLIALIKSRFRVQKKSKKEKCIHILLLSFQN